MESKPKRLSIAVLQRITFNQYLLQNVPVCGSSYKKDKVCKNGTSETLYIPLWINDLLIRIIQHMVV